MIRKNQCERGSGSVTGVQKGVVISKQKTSYGLFTIVYDTPEKYTRRK